MAKGSQRTLVGFALAGLACGDSTCAAALEGLSPALRGRLAPALGEVAALGGPSREAFLRDAAARGPASPPARLRVAPGLARALAALAEPPRTEDELALLTESGWLG